MMVEWLKFVLLISQLTIVISSIIVVKLDGEDNAEVKQIASIIEAKIHKQNEEVEKLKNITETHDDDISFLNSTMNYEHIQQQKVNDELKKVAQAQTKEIASLNSTFKDAYNTQQTEIENLAKQKKEMEGKIQEILNKTKRIPSWFYETQLCYQWRPDGDGGQCGAGESRLLCAYVGSKTPYYRDDTDRRRGGCRMQWAINSPNAESWFKSVQICYRWYADGDGGQCGGGAPTSQCASIGKFTSEYRDDTDKRSGGCRMSWQLSIPGYSPHWLRTMSLCFDWYADGDGGQCGGGVGQTLCATANSWTSYYRDDTDNRSGGCRMSWSLHLRSYGQA